MEISQPLADLDWIPRPRLLALRRLGLETVEDLLTHFPRRHEDRHQFPQFPHEESDIPICLCGEVVKTSLRRFGGWKKIFEATLQEPNANALSQPLVCRWFNLHYVQKMIATGQQLVTTAFNMGFAFILVCTVFGWRSGSTLVRSSYSDAKVKASEMKDERKESLRRHRHRDDEGTETT